MIELTVNGELRSVDVEPMTPLLWVIRDTLGMTGTKFGCGVGMCGACTVHLDEQPVRSCVTPVQSVGAMAVTTIEGLRGPAGGRHPVQDAWIAEQVPQCGYCQSGQIMMAAALLERNPSPSDDEVSAWMTNYCRCATYGRIRAGIARASAEMPAAAAEPPEGSGDLEASARASGGVGDGPPPDSGSDER